MNITQKNIALAISSSLLLPAISTPLAAEEQVEKISVIGSRLSVRSATETTAPVDIISSEQLTATGLTETSRALQFLVPSFNFPSSSITDGSDAVRPASLRGLSPSHTLVLVNGKRRHGSALVHLNGTMGRGSSNVDLNAIPVSAIKRIEILRDGAAAQYGSDAIAGVINIVLKDQPEGGELSLNAGQTYEGDGEQYKINSNAGFRFADTGFVNLSAEYHHKNYTNRAGADSRPQYLDGDPREATANRNTFRVGDAAFENLALFVNAGYEGSFGEVYAFGGFSHRESESAAFFRRPNQISQNIPEIYPDGYLPVIAPETDDHSLTAGYKFTLADWQLDLSANTGASRYYYYVNNSLNASYGPDSPTSAYSGGLKNSEQNVNLDASRLFRFVNDSDLVLSTGISYRNNKYQIFQGEELSYRNYGYQGKAGGIQSFPGFTPESEVDESRHNTGIYLEVENQLTNHFSWGAAARYEDYSDFGSNTSWKLAGRYQFENGWAVRSTLNSGFRAPSVQQLYFSSIAAVVNSDGGITETGTFNNVSPVVRALGQGELQPEESQSVSLGITYQGDNITFTLDAYQIDIDDRVILTSNAVNRNDYPVIDQLLGDSPAQTVRFFTNGLDTRTKGIEGVFAYQFEPQSWGDVRFTLSAAYNENEIRAIKIPALLEGLESVLLNYQEQVRQTKANPKYSGAAGLTHSYGKFTTNVRLNLFGPYTLAHNAADNLRDKEYSAKTLADISVNYAYTDNLSFTVGVQNLFDTYPDEQPESVQAANGGVFKYPNINAPFGFNGGYYYGEVTYRF
ncbi:TonB-dependent receptor [Chromatiaceae bacterium AAb-1]|nr:TonB-dependent receptor [Chromatiaceae bacterium AAb-1]